MQFESRESRAMWRNFCMSLIPEAVFSAIITMIVDENWGVFFAIFLGLQVVYLAIWVKNSIWLWTLFHFGGRAAAADIVFHYLKKNALPMPLDRERSATDYLERAMFNDDLEPRVRIAAAHEHGVIEGAHALGQVQVAMRMRMAYEDGMEKYQKYAPASEEKIVINGV